MRVLGIDPGYAIVGLSLIHICEKAASYVQELGLSEEHPVYQCNFSGELQSLWFQMQKHNTYDTSDQYLLEGCLYQFFSILQGCYFAQ